MYFKILLSRRIGKDILNYFENRGYRIIINGGDFFDKTLIVENVYGSSEELNSFMYVLNVIDISERFD